MPAYPVSASGKHSLFISQALELIVDLLSYDHVHVGGSLPPLDIFLMRLRLYLLRRLKFRTFSSFRQDVRVRISPINVFLQNSFYS